jgi:hypothetical protein
MDRTAFALCPVLAFVSHGRAQRRRRRSHESRAGNRIKSARAIGIQGVGQENAGAEQGKKCCDSLGHRTHPYLLRRERSPSQAWRLIPAVLAPPAPPLVTGLGFRTFSSSRKMASSVSPNVSSCDGHCANWLSLTRFRPRLCEPRHNPRNKASAPIDTAAKPTQPSCPACSARCHERICD